MKNKNFISFSLVLLGTLVLSSCGNTTSNPTTSNDDKTNETTSQPTSTPTTSEIDFDSTLNEKLFISEVFTYNMWGFVEICNLNEKAVDLTGYKINIYKSAGKDPYHVYEFEDGYKLEPNDFFSLSNKDQNTFLTENTDAKLPKFLIFGSNAISLEDPSGEEFDIVGKIGFQLEYCKKDSYLRVPWHLESSKTDDEASHKMVRVSTYKEGVVSSLNNLNFPFETEKEMMEGPRLSEEMLSYSYVNAEGGVTDATVVRYIDADTTAFKYADPQVNAAAKGNSNRYIGVDAPELDHTGMGADLSGINPDPYGNKARVFTNKLLKNSKGVKTQAPRGNGSIKDTYGRMLGYIWYTNDAQKSLESYSMINYELALNGYSPLPGPSAFSTLFYKNICFETYLTLAYDYAWEKNLNACGDEQDPEWNYESDKTPAGWPYDISKWQSGLGF